MDHPQSKITIGVLAGWQVYRTATNLSYLAPIFRGISHAANTLGCNVMLGCGIGPSASPIDPLRPAWPEVSNEQDFVPVGPWNTDGLIIAVPLHSQARSDYIREVRRTGHPVLFVGTGEVGPTICADNRGGILEAIGHLAAHGHRRIAFIAGTLEDMHGDSGERLRAYREGLDMYDLHPDPNLVVYGRHVYNGGYHAVQQLIEKNADFSALIASNDESALGAMQALKDAGRSVPDDVAVIGFDNRLEGSAYEPALTSVHVPLFDIGYRAVDRLLKFIEGRADLPEMIQVSTHLVIRESCGCRDLNGKGGTQRLPVADLSLDTLSRTVSSSTLDQAHSITEQEGHFLSQQLVETFALSIQKGDNAEFRKALAQALDYTEARGDDTHLWQSAITLMHEAFSKRFAGDASLTLLISEFLSQARLEISTHMRRQHRKYVVDERMMSSRLSLLTARLFTALDEMQIYEVLANHLPGMNIHTALIVLFQAEGGDLAQWAAGRDLLNPQHGVVRFRSRDFPPPDLIPPDQPFMLTLVPLSDQSGQIGFMVFDAQHLDLYGSIIQQVGSALNAARLYREATEGRRLAEEANQMKDRFLSSISHELRTPLNIIVGLSEMVLRDSDENESALPESLVKDIERIHTYSQHLGGLIGDVIDLATSNAGRLRLNSTLVDLGKVLQIVAETGSKMAADKGLRWETNLSETGPWVWADATRLRQVMLNLISNAIKFTSHGAVSLHIRQAEHTVTLVVQDTGIGIPLEEQQAIFDEFRQSARSIHYGYGGLGLGLAISQRIVEMHGGTISVQSSGEEGAGSTFSVTLPMVNPLSEQKDAADEATSAKPAILIIGHDRENSMRLGALLKQRTLEVSIVVVQHAYDWQRNKIEARPDAIVVDVSTDTTLGWTILREVKASQTLANTPVFFFGASDNDDALLELDYLTKPVDVAEVIKALDHHWLMTDVNKPNRTVLIVDDEPSTLEMYARIVQSHAASNRVLKAHDGREALQIMRRECIDLVLLDLQMPEMDGFQVLETMRSMESMRSVPVIVITGKVLTESDMKRLDTGIAAVLGKGLFSIEETIAHISAALERKRKLSAETRHLVRLAMGFIHQNFANPLSRGDIARHVGISEDHLTFCFRQELRTTPITYLQRYRVNQAKMLLSKSQRTITEIAHEVGFSDSSYFSRIFHREVGMSPDVFRRL